MKTENTNLRLSDGLLQPVGKPFIHTSRQGFTPAGRLGGEILFYKCSELFIGNSAEGLELGSPIRCAVVRSNGNATVMTDKGPVQVLMKDGILQAKTEPEYPVVRLIATAGATISATVDKRTLSSDFTEQRFKDSDAKAVIADLCDAYMRLCETSSANGSAIQPALTRYKLTDSLGRTVFTSPTLFLSHPDGAQCGGYTELFRLEGSTIRGYTVEARPWHLDISIPDKVCGDIARLDVMMTPLFHPYDTSMSPNIHMGLRNTLTDPVARIALPGMSRGTGGSYGESIVREAFARMDSLEHRIASIHNPFDGNARTIRISPATSSDPMADTNAIKNALARRIESTDRTLANLSSAGGFSASSVADNGSTLLWSGLRILRSPACSPAVFSADAGDSDGWGSTIAVRFGGNKGIVKTYTGTTGAIRNLGAILSYPSADAVEISISINAGGKFYTGTFPLSPDSSGRSAVYISPGLKRIALEDSKSPIFSSFESADENLSDALVFTDADTPMKVKGYCRLGDECMGLACRKAINQAWDFGRSRFVAATGSAVLSVAISQSGAISVNKLSDVGINRKDAIVRTNNGDICIVLTDGGICCLTTSGRMETFDERKEYIALTWNRAFSELWALRQDGKCLVFGDNYEYLRDDIVHEAFINTEDETFGICADGVAELATEIESPCRIAHNEDYDIAGFPTLITKTTKKCSNVRSLTLNITGSKVEGQASISAVSLDGRRETVLRTALLSGSCTAPVRMPLLTRLHRRLRLSLSVTVSPDFRLKA